MIIWAVVHESLAMMLQGMVVIWERLFPQRLTVKIALGQMVNFLDAVHEQSFEDWPMVCMFDLVQ